MGPQKTMPHRPHDLLLHLCPNTPGLNMDNASSGYLSQPTQYCMFKNTGGSGSNPSSVTNYITLGKLVHLLCLYFLICKAGIQHLSHRGVVNFKRVNIHKAFRTEPGPPKCYTNVYYCHYLTESRLMVYSASLGAASTLSSCSAPSSPSPAYESHRLPYRDGKL